jgi:asparagine synthase (glutamine-hydrolysing)
MPLAGLEGGVGRTSLAETTGPFDLLLDRWFEEAAERDFASQMMLVDMLSYLPGDILTKVDRMSMAVSLEARVPLLDHPLVEFAASLPARLKMRDHQGKWLLRRAVAGLVPEAVLTKPKQGFAVPLGAWLRGPLRHRLDALLDPRCGIYEFVEADLVRRVVEEHRRGRRDHSALLWRLVVLDVWLRALAEGGLCRPTTAFTGSALEETTVTRRERTPASAR